VLIEIKEHGLTVSPYYKSSP